MIIKSFWNIYLSDNYCFKDLIIKIKGIYLGTQVENMSRYDSHLRKPLKKSPNQAKVENWTRHMASSNRHFTSADLALAMCQLAQLQGPAQKSLDQAKTHLFQFFKDKNLT